MSETDPIGAAEAARVWQHQGSASVTLSGRAVLAAWAISFLIHLLLLCCMVVLVFPFAPKESQPNAPVALAEIVGSIDAPDFVPTPAPQPAQSLATFQQALEQFTPREFTPLDAMKAFKKPELSIIGIGAGGGDFADLGLSIGHGEGPEFFGLGRTSRGARKIVYVVDRSGSMTDTFVYVQQELRRSISALRRSQKFHVIFFNAGRPLENPPRRLVSAIRAHKETFLEFLEGVGPKGGTNPGPALHRALDLEPDLIYLLSDGVDFDADLLEKLKTWNENRKVEIYTIAYLDRSGSELLQLIARQNNGKFKYVTEHDLP